MINVADKMEEIGLELPELPKQSGHYLSAKRVGNMLYISGITCKRNGEVVYRGKVGEDITLEEGYEAAKICALNVVAVLKNEVGDFAKVNQIVKMVGYVQCDSSFGDVPKVINGASDLLVSLFGEKGEHVRCAVGVSSLPGKASVETDLMVELKQ